MSRVQDIIGVLRGVRLVGEATFRTQEAYARHLWANSSIREVVESNISQSQDKLKSVVTNPGKELENAGHVLKETAERTFVVVEGIRQLASTSDVANSIAKAAESLKNVKISPIPFPIVVQTVSNPAAVSGDSNIQNSTNAQASNVPTSIHELDISSITLKELETILTDHNKNRKINLRFDDTRHKFYEEEKKEETKPVAQNIPLPSEKQQNVPPTIQPVEPKSLTKDESTVKSMLNIVANYGTDTQSAPKSPQNQELSSVAKQRKVPSSRIARMASFGGLFASVSLNTVGELVKGTLGIGGTRDVKEAFLNPANTEKIVETLCKVRGAALKLGQILSIQDSNVVSPQLVKAFDRVRQSADYMPDWQVNKVMEESFGKGWKSKLASFEERPFAAASIGQVHRGVMHDGTAVAIKIQYPGVAKGIESDIDNLVGMMKIWDVFPAGIFIDSVVTVAKRELAWEVDYVREADYTTKFAEMIADVDDFRVPKVMKTLSTENVLTTEFVPGVPIDQCFNLSQEHRNRIAENIMRLVLRELFVYRCMQTDPNWSNFLYDESSKKIMLIDFGATRFYSKVFMDNYLKIIIAATKGERQTVLKISREMGFLTGYETPQMEAAHVDGVFILGEVFCIDGAFDFGKQMTTKKIAELVPVMIAHRLCPPPDEIYSLHRKLSGAFLLCSRLNAKIDCKPLFNEIVANYKFG